MEEQQQCQLVTDYATSAVIGPKLRSFSAIKPETLEKLYLIRHWLIDPDNPASLPVPFKRPKSIRDFHYSVDAEKLTTTPLVIKEFQKQAIHHLVFMPRFILGDAVGLGKTLDVIVAFAWLKERNPDAKMVVITTKSTTYQWADEVRKYSTLRPYVMTDTYRGLSSSQARYLQMIKFLENDKKDIIIVKYDSLKGTRKAIEGKFDDDGNPVDGVEKLSEEIKVFTKIIKQHRGKVILTLDECHRFKSAWTQTRNLVFKVARWPERVWALTATVIKNRLDEFYSIATAIGICPLGYMGDFHEEYCLWREQYIGNGRTKKMINGYQNIPAFIQQMRPFFLGRSQRQVKEPLPKLSTTYHPIDLDARQSKILTDELPNGTIILPPAVFKIAGEWRERERDPDNLMTQLSIQQLVTNHWCLIDPLNEKEFHTKALSPKEECLLDMLDGDYRGEKVVVYTKYKRWIDRLQWLTENGHFTNRKFLRITGNENEKQRNDNKRKFQDPESKYDLIVINAAGLEGINLQQAAHMILLDAPWSWGDLIQLVGRMVRMASPHSACTLHVMVAKGTIDEYAIETLKGKKGIFEKILGESHSAGILDSGEDFNLDSGMDSAGTEEEFKSLLRAHVKKFGLRTFLLGEQINKAQTDEDYQMVFERKSGKKKGSKNAKWKSDSDWANL